MISGNTRVRNALDINRQQRLAADIARAQTQISSGKRLLAPSDDPAAAARIAEIGRGQADAAVWLQNVESAASLSSSADTALSGVSSSLDRAKELMLSATNGTASADNRSAIATELRSIAGEVDGFAATTDFRGAALFSDAAPLAIPVGKNVSIAPVDSKANIFGSVPTAGGPQSISAILDAAASAIELADPAARAAAGQASLAALDSASGHVATAHAEQGLRAQRLDTLRNRFNDAAVNATEERQGLESTDVTEAVARLQSKQITLQAAQAVYAQLNKSTLFDLLK